MRLIIKKKFFDQIVEEKKGIDFRDAHITFVCEETGRSVRVRVDGVILYSRDKTRDSLGLSDEEFDSMFEDDWQIAFHLAERGKVVDLTKDTAKGFR